MRFLALALLAVLALAQNPGPAPSAQVETSEGVHTVTFNTLSGTVRAYFPDDTSAGDTISGVVVAEPAGNTPEQKNQNMGVLTGTVVEVNRDQRQKVGPDGRAKWIVPAAIAGGAIPIVLRGPNGETIGQTTIPVASTPPEPSRTFELPTTGNAGHPTTVQGPFDGDASTTRVTIGGQDAKILAESPRQAVFSSPTTSFGQFPIEVRKGDLRAAGQFRNVGIKLTATNTNLIKGQTAVLTVTALGLQGIKEPAQMILINFSPTVVSVGGGQRQSMTIPPEKVAGDGTYSETRPLTGVSSGGFNISAFLQRPVAEALNLPREVDRALIAWQQATRIAITAAAQRMIRSDVLNARNTLDRLVKRQARSDASADKLPAELVRHYCFDLRDARNPAQVGFMRVPFALAFQAPSTVVSGSIDVEDVRRRPFSQFAAQFDANQAEGYIDLTSRPSLAVILIDKSKLGYTDRSAVVTAGTHQLEITPPRGKTCKKTVKLDPGGAVSVSCPM